MGKIHKITKNGQTIYPATTTDAVVNPSSKKSVTKELTELGTLKQNISIDGTQDYTNFKTSSGYVNNEGTYTENSNFLVTDFIYLKRGDGIVVSLLNIINRSIVYYSTDKEFVKNIISTTSDIIFIAFEDCFIRYQYGVTDESKYIYVQRDYSILLSSGNNNADIVDASYSDIVNGYVNSSNNLIKETFFPYFFLTKYEAKEDLVVDKITYTGKNNSAKVFIDGVYNRDIKIGGVLKKGETLLVTSEKMNRTILLHSYFIDKITEIVDYNNEGIINGFYELKDSPDLNEGYYDNSGNFVARSSFRSLNFTVNRGDKIEIENPTGSSNIYLYIDELSKKIDVSSSGLDSIFYENMSVKMTFPYKKKGDVSFKLYKKWNNGHDSLKYKDIVSGYINGSDKSIVENISGSFYLSNFVAPYDGYIYVNNVFSASLFKDGVFVKDVKTGDYINAEEVIYLTIRKTEFDSAECRFIETKKSENDDVRKYFPSPLRNDNVRALLPKFVEHIAKLDKDVVVVFTGSSLTQGNIYVSPRKDAAFRPPLMHSNDMISLFWDMISKYFNQYYRLYDSGYFTESEGSWETIKTKDIWDDKDKHGWTRCSTDANASVSFEVPIGAWQFNFIYRTDTQGAVCKVSIAEGNNVMQVYDGSSWVEANNYTLSMVETAATETKGNTMYQKRLKMRCRNSENLNSTGSVKNVTISKQSGTDFNYVGVEWSKAEFMVTVINSGRGGWKHGLGGNNDLLSVQDSDIWGFNPDLVMVEPTIHNAGASWSNVDPNYFVNWVKRTYLNYFDDLPTSLFAKSNGWTDCEVCFYVLACGAHQTDRFFENDNEHKPYVYYVNEKATNGDDTDEWVGKFVSRFQEMEAPANALEKECNGKYAVIRADIPYFLVSANYYGGIWKSGEPTNECGYSLSYDGTHFNDNGSQLNANIIGQIL